MATGLGRIRWKLWTMLQNYKSLLQLYSSIFFKKKMLEDYKSLLQLRSSIFLKKIVALNDQRFLLIFIAGTYFGPHFIHELPRKSTSQRKSFQLPPYTRDQFSDPYTRDQFSDSVVRLAELENIYYFDLRKFHPSARLKLQFMCNFFSAI